MDKTLSKYTDESLNLRSFYLRLLKKIWILPVAALIGAVIAGGIYYLATDVFGPERKYEAQAKFHLTYSDDAYICNEEGNRVLDWYNGYTWTNFIFDDNDLVIEIAKALKEEGVDTADKHLNLSDVEAIDITPERLEDLQAAGIDITGDEELVSLKGEIPSNARFLLVTIRDTDKEFVEKITDAFVTSLEKYPSFNKMKAFDRIVCLSKSDAYLEKADNKMGVAMTVGAIVAAVLAFFAILLYDAVDEAVYVPEDLERRYGLPVLGTVFAGEDTDELFKGELAALYNKYVSDKDNVVFVSSDSVKDASFSEKDLEALKHTLGSEYESSLSKIKAVSVSDIGAFGGAVLAVPYGTRNAAMTEHVISLFKKHECPVLGAIFTRADLKFIKRYYGVK